MAEIVRVTHGCSQTWISKKDSHQRRLTINRTETNLFGIVFETWWNGPDAEPMRTELVLSQESIETLSGGLFQFLTRMDEWELALDEVSVEK